MSEPASWRDLAREIVSCERCARLRGWCREVARVKRRAFRDQEYWGKPVPGFGDPEARVLVVGLAPAAHGANRTGRMFTGDSSGDWLYAALHRAGFASQPTSTSTADGLKLTGVRVTATARCAPPGNKPAPAEIEACAPFLDRDFDLLEELRAVVALGSIAWDAVVRRAGRVAPEHLARPKPKFGHLAEGRLVVRAGAAPAVLIGSYHPSRQNTQTGRLTREMFDAVFARVRVIVG